MSRSHELEKSTQTDLLYGLSLDSESRVAVLEPAPIVESEPAAAEQEKSAPDVILQNAATRADSTLSAQVHSDGSAANGGKKARWRFQDGIAPPVRTAAPQFPQFQVEDRPRPLTVGTLAERLHAVSAAMLASFVVHVLLIPLLVLTGLSPAAEPWLATVESVQAPPQPPFEVVETPVVMGLSNSFDETLSVAPVTLEVSLPQTSIDPGAMQGNYSSELAAAATSPQGFIGNGPVGDALELFGTEAGQGKSQLGDGEGGAEFYGAKAQGNRFVFLVDCSMSMKENDRWLDACRELEAAVARLKEDQLFYVVLFDAGVHRMFNQDEFDAALYPATKENKERFLAWLRTVRLGYETRPFLSMKCALELRPDAIYLLSDGDFKDPTVEYLKEANRAKDHRGRPRQQVAVHTLLFHSRSLLAQATMKKIARENAGQYTFIPSK